MLRFEKRVKALERALNGCNGQLPDCARFVIIEGKDPERQIAKAKQRLMDQYGTLEGLILFHLDCL